MPLYEYRCQACSERSERIVPMASSDSPQACRCGGTASKVISNVAFHTGTSAGLRPPDVPLRRNLPSSLNGVGGTREGVALAQRAEEKLARFEARNPEFADDKMPVVSHEGGRIVRATAKREAADTTVPAAPRAPGS